VEICGTAVLLCHRYDVEAVEAKGAARKGSIEKKTDNVESYLYRMPDGTCGIPGTMLKAAICQAAKSHRDPRSPRKSAYDLLRAGVRVINDASLGKKEPDYLDKRRVVVQQNAVPRTRPAFKEGWTLKFMIDVIIPDYVDEAFLNQLLVDAGRLCGLGDFRPDFGTFRVTSFKRM